MNTSVTWQTTQVSWSSLCHLQLIQATFNPIRDNGETIMAYGIHMGIEIFKNITVHGIKTVHLYTINIEKFPYTFETLKQVVYVVVRDEMPYLLSIKIIHLQEWAQTIEWLNPHWLRNMQPKFMREISEVPSTSRDVDNENASVKKKT